MTRRRAFVNSFEELVHRPLTDRDGVNAVCWQRTLDGDFARSRMLSRLATA